MKSVEKQQKAWGEDKLNREPRAADTQWYWPLRGWCIKNQLQDCARLLASPKCPGDELCFLSASTS